MHTLRITAPDGADTTTAHVDFDDAQRALHTHAKLSDTYLRVVTPPTPPPAAQRACFELISLDGTRHRPNVIAAACIEPLVLTPAGGTVTPYYAAAAALHWISDQPRAHPALDAAHAAVHSTLMAGALWREAAALAELSDVPALPADVLTNIHHMLVTRGYRPTSAAALAAMAQRELDSAVTSEQVVVVTWWAALLTAAANT